MWIKVDDLYNNENDSSSLFRIAHSSFAVGTTFLHNFFKYISLQVLSVECSMLGHHIHHSHEDDNDSHIKAATARNSGIVTNN